MKSLKVAIDEYEWSMGNGQCHICYGLGLNWNQGFGSDVPNSKIGHLRSCLLARLMKRAGFNPTFIPKKDKRK